MKFRSLLSVLLIMLSGAAMAHGVTAGDLHIDHPTATPSELGTNTGSVYIEGFHNGGQQRTTRPTSASSPIRPPQTRPQYGPSAMW
jgi:hypothetical protein